MLVRPAPPQAAPGRVVLRGCPQKGAAQLRVYQQLVALPRTDDPAIRQEIGGGRGGQRPGGVLLHQQDGRPRAGEPVNDVEDLVGDEGGKPQTRLVQEQEARARHEGSADGHHLLFAPGEGGGRLIGTLLEPWESPEDLLQSAGQLRLVRLVGQGSQDQVLPHAEIAEHLASLGGEDHAQGGHAVGRAARDVPPVEQDAAARRAYESGDCLEEARLPGPVGPHDRHRLPRGHLETDAEECLGGPVVQGEILDREQHLPGVHFRHAVRLIFPR